MSWNFTQVPQEISGRLAPGNLSSWFTWDSTSDSQGAPPAQVTPLGQSFQTLWEVGGFSRFNTPQGVC